MADCFISYRRTPSSSLAMYLQAALKERGIQAYVDTTRLDSSTVKFPERLMTAIEEAPVFICILGQRDGKHTLESEWVLREIQRAYELQKFCIPIFQESYVPLEGLSDAVKYLLDFDGAHVLDEKGVMYDASVNEVAELIKPHIGEPIAVATTDQKRRLSCLTLLIILLVLVLIGLGAFIFLTQRNKDISPKFTLNPTTDVVQNIAETPTDTFTPTLSTPTLSGFQVLQTFEAERTRSAGTQAAFELTLTEQFISDGNATATAAQFAATETAAFATLLALSSTPTPRPTDTHTHTPTNTSTHTPTPTYTPTATNTPTATATSNPDPLQVAFAPVIRNRDWTPIERDFNGVIMVLVPAGCFDMGGTIYGDEKPIHRQCFDKPFWIDKYEVTQGQFRRLGGIQANRPSFYGDDKPVDGITWFEARDFCALRGSRLPTEAEWEYAARGPDDWLYPWGNTWNTNNAVWNRISTASVGSISVADSWVGALDMSGNVWEWTSSMYMKYPYDKTDGREVDAGSRIGFRYVLRGGSWSNDRSDDLRAPNRYWNFPNYAFSNFGFRCARSFG